MSKYLDSDGLLYLWNSKIKAALAKLLPLSGGTMTGKLKLSGAPTEDMDAATKKYVDDELAKKGDGDMKASTYDTNGNGTVDNAEKVNGHTVESDVPAAAVFTDTTYSNATTVTAGLMSADDYKKLANFSAASEYAKKTDITGIYKYKGSKASYSMLPTDGNETGDVWNVEDSGMNYAWTTAGWDALGAAFEIQTITNTEIDEITKA